VDDCSTSRSLLERVRDHNQEAWTRLVYLYAPLVIHWCHRWGLQRPDAEDIQQEVFQAVARSLDSFRRDRPGDTFRGWLRVITRRKLLDHRRRQERRPEAVGGAAASQQLRLLPEPADLDEEDAPEEVRRLHHRGLELVRSAFEPRTWQAFWRCAVDGQSPADVAQEMGMTPGAVRMAKSRVLRRLKTDLGDLLE